MILSKNDVGIIFFLGFVKGYAIPFQIPKYMLWNPHVLWDTQRRVMYVSWIFMDMNKYPFDSSNQNN